MAKTPKRPTGNFGSSSTKPNTFSKGGKMTTKKSPKK
jgi:hypothetical protein